MRSDLDSILVNVKGCTYRTPVVADYRTAHQAFDTQHPAPGENR